MTNMQRKTNNTQTGNKAHNKAQGLSLNTMVVAAIAIVILVVIIAIFTGGIGDFNTDLKKSSKQTCQGGEIKPRCDPNENTHFGNFGEGMVCCEEKERCSTSSRRDKGYGCYSLACYKHDKVSTTDCACTGSAYACKIA